MAKCPVCGKTIFKKAVIPGGDVTGKYIDCLAETEICDKCRQKLSVFSAGADAGEKAREEAKKYINSNLAEIGSENLAAIIDLHVNRNDGSVEAGIAEAVLAEYSARMEKRRNMFSDAVTAVTPSGIFAIDKEEFVFAPAAEIPYAKILFGKQAKDRFPEYLKSYTNDGRNILQYAIEETKNSILPPEEEVFSVPSVDIVYYRQDDEGVCLKYGFAGIFSEKKFGSDTLSAFEQLIPEKEYSLYEQMVEKINSENIEEVQVEEEVPMAEMAEAIVPDESVQPESAAPAGPAPIVDKDLARIRQLKELLDIGAITKTEYRKKKKQLLGLD